jgi:uncharacterized protein
MATSYETPGLYMVEEPGPRTIAPVGTSTAAFVGTAPDQTAHIGEAWPVNNWSQFVSEFASTPGAASTMLSHGVYGFFQNGGGTAYIINLKPTDAIAGTDGPRTGLKLLEEIDEISIVVATGYTDAASHAALIAHCEKMGNRVCILDVPIDIKNTDLLKTVESVPTGKKDAGDGGSSGGKSGYRPPSSTYATCYFPGLRVADALNPKGDIVAVPPSGHMAGIWARTDRKRGVHKAPANESVLGALGLTYRVTAEEQGPLNSAGVNIIRFFPDEGIMVWGARTLAESSSEWRWANVRRTAIFIEQSILNSTRWIVFEPNDRSLWKTIRSEITGFLKNVHRDGALMGRTPEEAFFVKCDEETNPQESIDMGQVITVIGLAIVKPAEFVIFKISQQAGGAKIEAA